MTPDTPDALLARAGWCRLLAGVFAEEPRGDFLETLRSEAALAELASLGVRLPPEFASAEVAALEEALACEYTMLFVAPGGFPPVESVRLQGGYQQAAAGAVHTFYAAEGFAVAADGRFYLFDDHLAVELNFAGALLERRAEALKVGDTATAAALDKALKRFWAKHLGLWVRGFADLIERAAEHPFYREMSRLLRAFAQSELELLGLRVNDADGGALRAPRPAEVDQPMWCGAPRTETGSAA